MYATHALLEDVHVSGVPEFRIHGSSTAKETHWVAHLLDVAPDGSSRVVLRAYLNSRYHETGDPRTGGDGKDLVPGEVVEFALDSFPLDHVFQKGHRIALAVQSDDEWARQDTTFATNFVWHTPEHATRLVLPVVQPDPSAFLAFSGEGAGTGFPEALATR